MKDTELKGWFDFFACADRILVTHVQKKLSSNAKALGRKTLYEMDDKWTQWRKAVDSVQIELKDEELNRVKVAHELSRLHVLQEGAFQDLILPVKMMTSFYIRNITDVDILTSDSLLQNQRCNVITTSIPQRTAMRRTSLDFTLLPCDHVKVLEESL